MSKNQTKTTFPIKPAPTAGDQAALDPSLGMCACARAALSHALLRCNLSAPEKAELKAAMSNNESKIKFLVNPALSVGNEASFDANATDLLVALNAQGDIWSCLQSSDDHERDELIRDDMEPTFEAKTHLVLTGFQSVTPGNIRVACGIFEIALETAQRLKARRISLLINRQQYRGDIKALASVLKCRARVFEHKTPELELQEVELLCHNSDVSHLQEGLDAVGGQLCRTCFKC